MSRAGRLAVLLCLATLGAAPAGAHEVQHAVEAVGAVAVRLTYADGKPFAFEAFEAYPDGQELPAQVGRTDAQGRAVFVPGGARQWRLKAYSADGHGVELRFAAPRAPDPGAPAAPPADATPNRASMLLFGLSLLLGAFAMVQLRLKKR